MAYVLSAATLKPEQRVERIPYTLHSMRIFVLQARLRLGLIFKFASFFSFFFYLREDFRYTETIHIENQAEPRSSLQNENPYTSRGQPFDISFSFQRIVAIFVCFNNSLLRNQGLYFRFRE